jgi:hypothetical protein
VVEPPILSEHPAFKVLLSRFIQARMAYADPKIQEACALIGLTERQYCNHFVRLNYPTLIYAGSDTDDSLTREHYDAAFEEAKPKGTDADSS